MSYSQSPAEKNLLKVFNDELDRVRKDERRQALTDVSGILGWLTYDPPIPHEKLLEYVLAEFEKATPYDCKDVKDKINFYRKCLDSQK